MEWSSLHSLAVKGQKFPIEVRHEPGYGWMIRCSNLAKAKEFISSPERPEWLWVPHRLPFSGFGVVFSQLKRPEREADHSPPPSALSRLPLYDFMACIRNNLLSYEVYSFRFKNSGIQALKSQGNIAYTGQRYRVRSDSVSLFAQPLND